MSSVSPVVVEDEYKEATESGMLPLIGLALLLIAALILLFLRTLSDLLLTLVGLLFSLIWVIGAEGWLGPDALGLIGPPSSLSAMVPIIEPQTVPIAPAPLPVGRRDHDLSRLLRPVPPRSARLRLLHSLSLPAGSLMRVTGNRIRNVG